LYLTESDCRRTSLPSTMASASDHQTTGSSLYTPTLL